MQRLFIFFLFAYSFLSCSAEEKLFSKNQWHAVIVISDNPEIDEWYAARSLSDWAELVTGKKIDLTSESENISADQYKIYVGKTLASIKNKIGPPNQLGDAAIRKKGEKSIYLIGNNPASSRIAVGRFCEQALGITFCQPGINGADYTQLKEVSIPEDDLFQPAYRWRALGGLNNEVSKEWAYTVGYGNAPAFSHNLYKIFTEKEWNKDPSFFAEGKQGYIKPRGLGSDANPNLNHPQAVTLARQYAENWFRTNPDSLSVPMGVNDSLVFDKRVESEGWFRSRPVRTNYLIGFLNKVADGNWLNQSNPNETKRTIGTLAYFDTLKAPSLKVHPDIFPWVCVDRIGYANEEFAQQDINNCSAWVKSGADHIGAYDYWYGYSFCVPRVNFSSQDRSIKKLNAAGVTGWYAEIYPLWAFDAPKAWVGAKLLERPEADLRLLLNQWFEAAYGPASQPMRALYEEIERAWTQTLLTQGKDQWLYGIFDESAGEILDDQSIKKIIKYLDTAEKELGKIKNPNTQQRNYQWRLNQFREAWNIVVDFREVVRLRKAQPRTPEEALQSLENLAGAEQLLEEEQTQFNFKWGTMSQKINWSRFSPTNPREKWIQLINQNPQLKFKLSQVVQEDAVGLSILNWTWELKKSQAETLHTTASIDAFNKNWVLETSARQNSESLNHSSLIALRQQSGRMLHTENISPKKIIRFTLTHNPVGGKINLFVNFKGKNQNLIRSQQVIDVQESLVVLSPQWTEQIEFSVQFENAIDLKALEISQLSP